jgi:hypothetical protein
MRLNLKTHALAVGLTGLVFSAGAVGGATTQAFAAPAAPASSSQRQIDCARAQEKMNEWRLEWVRALETNNVNRMKSMETIAKEYYENTAKYCDNYPGENIPRWG